MSPKEGAITALKPAAASAVTAFSREEPQPKFRSATSTCAPRKPSRFITKSGFSAPSASKRRSWKR